jgi:tyrosyl-tRNA synthetase
MEAGETGAPGSGDYGIMPAMFRPVDEQLEILLRGCRFADEVEGATGVGADGLVVGGGAGAGGEAGTGGDAGVGGDGDTAGRSLRAQMTAELRERLTESARDGRPLRVYLGVDPTATSLHIGHFVPLQKLRQFQELGHQVIFLIGDYTAMIGDPSGQENERKRLSHDEVMAMGEDYERQAFLILDPKRTEVRANGEWLSELKFAELVELASIFPLKWVISRRDFAERLERGESLRMHETFYSIMQGYDAFALHCDVQVGAYDQHFNLLAGRWIQERLGEKPHVMLTLPLLEGTDGRKMSKSYGNQIPIRDTPEDMYGKTMRVADDFLPSYLELATTFPGERVDALKRSLVDGTVNPMEVKKELALHLVELYHGASAARAAADHFRTVVQEKTAPEEITEVELPGELAAAVAAGGLTWPDLLVALKLAKSKSEVRRLMQQRGFYVEQEPVTDIAAKYTGGGTLVRLGKRKYYRIAG